VDKRVVSGTELSRKAHVKAGIIRLTLRKSKSTGLVEKSRREILSLLKNGDDEKARIIAEQALKEENNVKAFEELQAMCEEVSARLGIISSSK
jgi:beta-phosphoglucomutase-like phosphatase (HAD superfamily)